VKNIVFIPNIDLGNSRSDSYHYSIKSWKRWCDKNDCELFVLEDLLFPVERMKVTFQRYYLFDILEDNNIDYDQILMVDADTIVHPDCPNFFEESDGKYCGVAVEGCHEWVSRSIRNYNEYLFSDLEAVKQWEYINGGFQIVNKNHKQFFQDVIRFYWENSDKLLYAQENFRVGTDQTPINFLLRKYNIDLKILPQCYNLQDLNRKNLLYLDERCWWSDELHFLNSGWVYHFNSIPANPLDRGASYWIKRTYEEIYNENL
tara:strand:+ start:6290 stop:7069 length:780 start_codon:yes stop_codon:yes gene_type:complete